MSTLAEERATGAQRLRVWAEAVLPHLEGWGLVGHRRDVDGEIINPSLLVFRNPEGAEFTVNKDWRGDKVLVSGSYPRHEGVSQPGYNDRDPAPTIGVGLNREGRAAAADIARRFLPQFLAHLAKHNESIIAAEAYRLTSEVHGNQLAEILGDPRPQHDTRNGQSTVRWNPQGRGYGDFKVSGDSVSLEVRMIRPDVAIKIAQLLAAEQK